MAELKELVGEILKGIDVDFEGIFSFDVSNVQPSGLPGPGEPTTLKVGERGLAVFRVRNGTGFPLRDVVVTIEASGGGARLFPVPAGGGGLIPQYGPWMMGDSQESWDELRPREHGEFYALVEGRSEGVAHLTAHVAAEIVPFAARQVGSYAFGVFPA